MSTVLNRNHEQESAMIMSALKRYFGEDSQSQGPAGSDSSLMEAINAYFKDRGQT